MAIALWTSVRELLELPFERSDRARIIVLNRSLILLAHRGRTFSNQKQPRSHPAQTSLHNKSQQNQPQIDKINWYI
jgi:hypothetical protein